LKLKEPQSRKQVKNVPEDLVYVDLSTRIIPDPDEPDDYSMLRNRISLDGSTAGKEQSFIERHNLPDKVLQTREYQSILSDAVDTLPGREATILKKLYHDGLKLREVGDELGVCASRILQLRRKACAGMRAALAERGIDAGEFKKGSVPRSPALGVQNHGLRRVTAGVLRD